MIDEAAEGARRGRRRNCRSRRCRHDFRHRICAVPRRPAALQEEHPSGHEQCPQPSSSIPLPAAAGRVSSEIEMTRELRRVAVIGGVRIPFCRSNTLLRRSVEPRHDDGGVERSRRSLRPQGTAHRRSRRRRRRHALEGLQSGARSRALDRSWRRRRPASR